ncbi:MAG: DEAD/DEAH box helicase [Turicibacter sp.]|nr:DEAD/DEAH box helicase [Turicibacter sp.]
MEEVLFKDLSLSAPILEAIEDMGYVKPSPIQAQAIPVVASGQDIIGQAQTGTGKTAAFMLPLLGKIDTSSRDVQVLVLCPTRELANQVHDETKKFAKKMRDIQILAIYGGASYDPQIRALKRGVHIVVGTPGRVMDHMNRGTLKLQNLKVLVLDEADEMLNMGFKDDIETILEKTPAERQTVMFSATMPQEILRIARTYQKDPEIIKVVSEELSNKKIDQYYIEVRRHDRLQAMIRTIDMMGLTSSIVFTNTKREVDELVSKLQEEGYVTEGLHGDLKQAQRDRVMNSFRKKTVNILVATDIAARGIDVSNVEAVFNYDIPLNEENYVHRIGRTGRAGMTGLSITFVFGKDMFRVRRIESFTKSKMTKMNVPTVEEIRAKRSGNAIQEIVDQLNIEGADFTKENEMLAQIMEQGFTMEQIAAGLLRLTVGKGEKQYAYIEEVASFGDRGPRERTSKGPRRNEVRLFVNVGSKNKVRAKDFVGMITKKSDIPSRAIGDIDVTKKCSFLNVDKAYASQIIRKLNSKLINGKPIRSERATAELEAEAARDNY